MNDIQKIYYLLETCREMVIATVNDSGEPHISPVFFAYDNNFNLYWVSSKKAVHSKSIRINNQVDIVVFGKLSDGKNDGVYFNAEAYELTNESEISEAIKLLNKKPQSDKFKIKSHDNVVGKASWRIYKAVPHEISKREDAIDEQSGQAITVRKVVDISKL